MDKPTPFISIVTPVYKAEDSLAPLYERLKITMEQEITPEFEIIMVNDNSPDDCWQRIKDLVSADPRVKGIHLSRNFGQYYALAAGLDKAKGEWVFILDCDLQDLPEELPALYQKALEGYDIVLAQRMDRQDGFIRRFFSKTFYRLFSYLTDTQFDPRTAQFGVYHRKVIDTLVNMREKTQFLPAFIQWVGFRVTAIPVQHQKREQSPSGYSLAKLFGLAFDSIIGFSDKPLRLIVQFGFLLSVFSLLSAVFIIIRSLLGVEDLVGWPSLIVSIWFFSSMIIFLLGVNGLYISKIYEEVKRRPLYIISEIFENTAHLS
jgi:polyisoprenyl-phosphate glycosyltransferase